MTDTPADPSETPQPDPNNPNQPDPHQVPPPEEQPDEDGQSIGSVGNPQQPPGGVAPPI